MDFVTEIRNDADLMDRVNDPNAGWAGYIAERLEEIAAMVELLEKRAANLGSSGLERLIYEQCAREMRGLLSSRVSETRGGTDE